MLSTSWAVITASGSTLQNRAILALISLLRSFSVRHRRRLGWMPTVMLSSLTLCWVGLTVLTSPAPFDEGHGEVDVADVVLAQVALELPDGLQKGEALDVAHGAADFDDRHVTNGATWRMACFISSERDLDRAAQIIAPALLGDDVVVNAAGGEIILLARVTVV